MRKSRSRRKTRRGGAVTQAICDTAQKAQDEAIKSGKEIAWKADVDGLKLLSFDTCNAYTGNKTDPKCLKFRDDLANKDPVFCRAYLKKHGSASTVVPTTTPVTSTPTTDWNDAKAKQLVDSVMGPDENLIQSHMNIIMDKILKQPDGKKQVTSDCMLTLKKFINDAKNADVAAILGSDGLASAEYLTPLINAKKGTPDRSAVDKAASKTCKSRLRKGGSNHKRSTRKGMRRKTARKAYSKKRGGAMLLRCQEGVQRAMGPWACGTAQFGGRKSRRGGTHCSPKSGKKCPYYQKYGYHKY